MPLSATILGTENAVGFFRIGFSPHGEASTKPHVQDGDLRGLKEIKPRSPVVIPEVGDAHGIARAKGKSEATLRQLISRSHHNDRSRRERNPTDREAPLLAHLPKAHVT